MVKEIKQDDSRYFYLVVFMTFVIVGLVAWQSFFASYQDPKEMTNPRFQRMPEFDFVFFDSYPFQALSPFVRGDDPLLLWDKIRNKNPFESPRIPQDRELRNWWELFNISLEFDGQSWIGSYPSLIKTNENPEIILFEGRWYKIKITNETEEDVVFQLINKENEIVAQFDEVGKNESQEFEFLADRRLAKYILKGEGSIGGDIRIVEDDDYELITETEEEEEVQTDEEKIGQEALIELGQEISRLYETIQTAENYFENEKIRDISQVYADYERLFREIESNYYSGISSDSEIIREAEIMKEEIKITISSLEAEIEEAEFTEVVEPEDPYEQEEEEIEPEDPYEQEEEEDVEIIEKRLNETWDVLVFFGNEIEYFEEEEKDMAMEYHFLLEDRLVEVQENYDNEEITEEDAHTEINEIQYELSQAMENFNIAYNQ